MRRVSIILLFLLIWFGLYLDYTNRPKFKKNETVYGVSFSKTRSKDLNLPWEEVYRSIIEDLKVKNLRLGAYWPEIEPKRNQYDFSDLDYQLSLAQKNDTKVILAMGRRLPGWPECHQPNWVQNYSSEDQQRFIEELISKIVNRYKNHPAVSMWQVENEPFFDIFTRARKLCPPFKRENLLSELRVVKSLDPNHLILLTDAGEFGTWLGAYKNGDIFGTSMYLYVWNRNLGYIRYPIGPWFFRLKHGLVKVFYGSKKSIVAELQSEPWIPNPLINVPINEQLKRFDLKKMDRLINYSYRSGLDHPVYLWGAEWWYWMKTKNHPEFWNRAKLLFSIQP